MAGLNKISNQTNLTMAEIALGWCTLNPQVSTVILGASRPEQLIANLKTLKQLNQIKSIKPQLDLL